MRDLETFDGRSQLSDGREEEELLREKQRSETKTKGWERREKKRLPHLALGMELSKLLNLLQRH